MPDSRHLVFWSFLLFFVSLGFLAVVVHLFVSLDFSGWDFTCKSVMTAMIGIQWDLILTIITISLLVSYSAYLK